MANSNSRQFGINDYGCDDPKEPGARSSWTDLPDDANGGLFTTPPVRVQSAPQPTYSRPTAGRGTRPGAVLVECGSSK